MLLEKFGVKFVSQWNSNF